MINENNQILKELKEIKTELKLIKDNMPNKDMFLTVEEEQLLEESYLNEKKGELISSKNLKEELKI